MKKLVALFLIFALSVCCFVSCKTKYYENVWFSSELLNECGIPDFPTVEGKETLREDDWYETVFLALSYDEYFAYINGVYQYLVSCDFKYLGTRGETRGTVAGGLTTFYFKHVDSLDEFRDDSGSYIFIFSDGSTDDSGDVVFNILELYNGNDGTVENGDKKFNCNTSISLTIGSHTPINGYYFLEKHRISCAKSTEEFLFDIPTEAPAGETVVIKSHIIHDASLILFVNGESIGAGEAVKVDGNYSHWEYSFIMPDCGVYITCEIGS